MMNRDWQAYVSMEALRRAHEDLFDELPKLSSADRDQSVDSIEEFINRAIATGKILDTVSDRREAQGMIDYWVASSYTRPRSRGISQAGPQPGSDGQPNAPGQSALTDAPAARRSDNQLDKFDPSVIDTAASKGEEFLRTLSNRDRELARQILFRMIHFPDSGDNFAATSARLDELRKFADPVRVDRLIDGLKAAGVISVKSADDGEEGEVATLHYVALTRRWKWLDAEVKKRMNFRELALSWVGSGRSRGALLNLALTRQFREYSNLTEWETAFVNRSSRLVWTELAIAGTVLLVLTAVAVGGFYTSYRPDILYQSNQFETVNREIRLSTTPVAKQVEDINWLAKFRLPINVNGVDFGKNEQKDLSGIFAPGAVFTGSKLNMVKFDDAYLGGASFNFSIIGNTGFKEAKLSRARFDAAEFRDGVDFTGADLLHANWRGTKFSGEYIPVLAGTPWWLVNGLSFEQIKLLNDCYPHMTSAKEYAIYQRQLDDLDRRLDQDKDPLTQAKDLNEKAWTLATLGVVNDGVAEKAARAAIGLLNQVDQTKPDMDDNRQQFDDTLAYILLQKSEGDPTEKKKNLEEAVNLLETAITAKSDDGGISFRSAVASFASNRDWETSLRDALIQKQYEPTHELYLLNQYITGNLMQRVMDDTRRLPSKPLTNRCPRKPQAK